MREISLHILDIVQNSISAGASLIGVSILESSDEDLFTVKISDNGKGMSEELVKKVTDPFTTSRTTRKVGLGIPLFKAAAELTGGSFEINSELGRGTVVTAVFVRSSIDRQPLGDIAGTMLGLFTSYESIDFVYMHELDGKFFKADTRDIKKILGGVSFSQPEVYLWLADYLKEGEGDIINPNI